MDPDSFAPSECHPFTPDYDVPSGKPRVSADEAFQQLICLRLWVGKRFTELSEAILTILPRKEDGGKEST
jgi:hypothetical protein